MHTEEHSHERIDQPLLAVRYLHARTEQTLFRLQGHQHAPEASEAQQKAGEMVKGMSEDMGTKFTSATQV